MPNGTVKWRGHLRDMAWWLLAGSPTEREREWSAKIFALSHTPRIKGKYSWRVSVTNMREELKDLRDRSESETWVMEKLWLLAQADAKNSGVKEEDIWK